MTDTGCPRGRYRMAVQDAHEAIVELHALTTG